MNSIEQRRQRLQKELDAGKTLQQRNKLGQYSTPYKLASKICRKLRIILGDEVDSVLEPAIGTGVFYSALKEECSIKRFVGYEIDSYYFIPTVSLWANYNVELHNEDFLTATSSEKFSLLISNPPYSRHHHIPTDIKKSLSNKVRELYGIEISGLSGLYVYFVILSTEWIRENGISCWLIPSEFLCVNYGNALKEFLLNKVDLISIHSFTSEDVQFDDALVSSSIVIFRNSKPSSAPISFSWGDDLENPKDNVSICKENLDHTKKWNKSFLKEIIINNDDDNDATIGTFFTVKRGIATGDNNFFVINKEIVKTYDIPEKFIMPVAPPPRRLKNNIYSLSQSENEGLFLISCSLPLDLIKVHHKGLYKYLCLGIETEVNMKSNCRNRDLWYKCETREVAPILVSYMGRDNGNSPIRFILNDAKATSTNSYLMLYPKKEYQYLFKDPVITKQTWLALSQIPKDILLAYGRAYGGGLLKWEPKELASIPCPQLKELLKPISPSLFD